MTRQLYIEPEAPVAFCRDVPQQVVGLTADLPELKITGSDLVGQSDAGRHAKERQQDEQRCRRALDHSRPTRRALCSRPAQHVPATECQDESVMAGSSRRHASAWFSGTMQK
jgi:hypothetical protein